MDEFDEVARAHFVPEKWSQFRKVRKNVLLIFFDAIMPFLALADPAAARDLVLMEIQQNAGDIADQSIENGNGPSFSADVWAEGGLHDIATEEGYQRLLAVVMRVARKGMAYFRLPEATWSREFQMPDWNRSEETPGGNIQNEQILMANRTTRRCCVLGMLLWLRGVHQIWRFEPLTYHFNYRPMEIFKKLVLKTMSIVWAVEEDLPLDVQGWHRGDLWSDVDAVKLMKGTEAKRRGNFYDTLAHFAYDIAMVACMVRTGFGVPRGAPTAPPDKYWEMVPFAPGGAAGQPPPADEDGTQNEAMVTPPPKRFRLTQKTPSPASAPASSAPATGSPDADDTVAPPSKSPDAGDTVATDSKEVPEGAAASDPEALEISEDELQKLAQWLRSE